MPNEKYVWSGTNAKTFTADFPTRKREGNVGQLGQYLAEHPYESIVTREIFELVKEWKEKSKRSHKLTLYIRVVPRSSSRGRAVYVCTSMAGSRIFFSSRFPAWAPRLNRSTSMMVGWGDTMGE